MNGTRLARNGSAAMVAGIAAWSSYSHIGPGGPAVRGAAGGGLAAAVLVWLACWGSPRSLRSTTSAPAAESTRWLGSPWLPGAPDRSVGHLRRPAHHRCSGTLL